MFRNKLLHLLSLSTLTVFVLSAVLTVPALADGGSAPPPAGTPSGARSTNKGSSNSLSQVPSGTKVVVVDASGNKLPLGSQEAQDILTSGDPVWCPSSVAIPTPGLGGCSPGLYNGDLTTLISNIAIGNFTPPSTNSTIWIEGGGPQTASVWLDGSLGQPFHPWANFTLTVKGGWAGCTPTCVSTIDTANPSVFTNSHIYITGWNNTVTMSNIAISGPVTGIYITTAKNIVLTNINASNNSDNGAYLDDSTGTGVTITNSTFNNNDLSASTFIGLVVYTKGSITVTDTTASGNEYGGAYLDSGTYGTGQVTLSGTNIFDDNGNASVGGLEVYSGGTITSGSLDANYNAGYGAYLHNTNGPVLPITLGGTSSFSENGGYGLYVHSNGAISVNNITADINAQYGAQLTNNFSSNIPSAVKVTGTNWFDENGEYGLSADSAGPISLNNINADDNGIAAGYDGLSADDGGAAKPESITLTGSNTFDNNGWDGAALFASGAVTVNNITAVCNGYSNICTTGAGGGGLLIVNDWLGSTKPQAVTLAGTNNLNFNDLDNLAVQSYGSVSISNLTADNSAAGMGADLYYYYHGSCCDPTGSVKLTGTNTFDGNHTYGLYATSTGTINASNLEANTNGTVSTQAGAFLDSLGSVTLTGTSRFNFNVGYGLDILTSGSITASNLTADTNSSSSASDSGVYLSSAKNVTLTGTNTFDFNHGNGLWIASVGTVSASNLTADTNSGLSSNDYGVNITSTGKVSLSGAQTFDFNHGYGLNISAGAPVTVSSVTAIGDVSTSQNTGVFLSSTGNVTLSGTNTFNSYSGDGLAVVAGGSISVSSLTANFNGYGGVSVNGAALESGGNVTLSGTNTFESNRGTGLIIVAGGTVSTSNLTAEADGASGYSGGVIINNKGAGSPKSVTMSGTNTFINNEGNGLQVLSHGSITASNITANYNNNGGDGAYLDNCDYVSSCQGSGNVTLTGTNVFFANALGFDEGLLILTNGNVSVTHITADYNDNDGMAVYDTGGTVTVTCGSFIGNGWDSFNGYGLVEFTTHGTPAHTYLSGVDASGNSYDLTSGIYNVTTTARTCTLP
ncbi:MAG TPA: right-handed parallel beta-helix repeat-containing protein [Anaerolineales bacterium]|nr:right-handed parallel beta-helix repeat-containing protein [Anaerolineales bacterium]